MLIAAMEMRSLKDEDNIAIDDYGTMTAGRQRPSSTSDDKIRILSDDQLAVSTRTVLVFTYRLISVRSCHHVNQKLAELP